MVAITVILAAVIGAFVLDLGDAVEQNVRAGASVTINGDDVEVTWVSSDNAAELDIEIDCGNDGVDVYETTLQEVGEIATHDCSGHDVAYVIAVAKGHDDRVTVVTHREVTVN